MTADKLIFNLTGSSWIEVTATTVMFISHDEYQHQNRLDITKAKLGQLILGALEIKQDENHITVMHDGDQMEKQQ